MKKILTLTLYANQGYAILRTIILVLLIFTIQQVVCQNKGANYDLDEVFTNIKNLELDKAQLIDFQGNMPLDLKKMIDWHIAFIKYGQADSLIFEKEHIPNEVRNQYEIIKALTTGDYYANKLLDYSSAYEFL